LYGRGIKLWAGNVFEGKMSYANGLPYWWCSSITTYDTEADRHMDARKHGQDGTLALPWKMYKAKFTSV